VAFRGALEEMVRRYVKPAMHKPNGKNISPKKILDKSGGHRLGSDQAILLIFK
jgi:hypothetical protein